MSTRYFEIRAPRADFTGKVGPISFADGAARVQFDDARDESGQVIADENGISPGRSMVMFARRRPGYTVTELDERGRPLAADGRPARPHGGSSKGAWRTYALSIGVDPELVDAAESRGDLIALVDEHEENEQ